MPAIQYPGTHEVKHVRVNASAAGDNEVIAAVAGKRIRVLAFVLTAGTAAGRISLQDTATTPVIHAQFDMAVNGGVSYPGGIQAPAFETAVGTGLEINNPGTTTTVGFVTFSEV